MTNPLEDPIPVEEFPQASTAEVLPQEEPLPVGFQIAECDLNQTPNTSLLEQQGEALEALIDRLSREESEGGETLEPEAHWLSLYERLLQSDVLLTVSKASPRPGYRTIVTMVRDAIQFPTFTRLETALQDEISELYDYVWVPFPTVCAEAIRQGADAILLNADGPVDITFDYYELKYMADGQLPPVRPIHHGQEGDVLSPSEETISSSEAEVTSPAENLEAEASSAPEAPQRHKLSKLFSNMVFISQSDQE